VDTSDDADLVVIGGGMAGLVAAARAATAGLKVRVLEKNREERYLCNSRVAGGVFHICATDIFSDPDELERKILQVTDGQARPRLARAIAEDGRRVARWLQSLGLRFIKGAPDPGYNFVLSPPALVRAGLEFEGRAGDVALRRLEATLVEAGGRILRGHRATELLNDSGRCAGVKGQGPQGPFEIRATQTLISDGGFQADMQRLSQHISPTPERLLQRNTRSGAGDGLRMAEAFGAAITPLAGFYGHLMAREALTNDKLWPMPWYDDIATAGMLVGPDGRRFADEGSGGIFLANEVARLPDPQSAVVIFNDDIWESAGKVKFYPANPYVIRNGGTILSAASIPELAAKAGLPAEALARTVDSFNEAVLSAATDTLAPPRTTSRFRAVALLRPPFHAAHVCAGITYTMGGIAIDEYSRVLDVHGAPLPGLYAAGATTGGLEGGPRVGYVGGLIKASTTGFRAAEHMLGLI
jgi:fumarate reductase flavoprotein subunit